MALVATLVLLAGCTDDNGDDGTETTTATATETTTATTTATATSTATETATEAATETATEATGEGLAIGVGETAELGSFLVDPEGMTLYIFTRDEPGVSNCSDGCLAAWPPLLLEEGQEIVPPDEASGTFATIERPEGMQVTYNDAPLYYWASDVAPGDTTGHGVNDVWFVAPLDGDGATSGGSASSASTPASDY